MAEGVLGFHRIQPPSHFLLSEWSGTGIFISVSPVEGRVLCCYAEIQIFYFHCVILLSASDVFFVGYLSE